MSSKKTPKSKQRSRQLPTSAFDNNVVGPRVLTLRDLCPKMPFPNTRRVTMQYAQLLQLVTDATPDYSTEWDFRLNSIFDPDFTGTGHQPKYHDTFATLYQKYLVHNVDITLEFYDTSADGIIVGGGFGFSAFSALTAGDLAERSNIQLATMSNSGEQRVVLRYRISPAEALGLTRAQYLNSADTYGATFGSNPTTVSYLRVVYSHPVSSSVSVKCLVRMAFDVQVSELKDPGQS